MFPFDQAALPQITTRAALIAVDLQNDFVGPDAALPVREPEGFLDRALRLAAAFRADKGDVVWVQSRFDGPRPFDPDQIVVSDDVAASRASGRPSSRRRIPALQAADALADGPAETPDPEAFLSHADPLCAKPASPGCDMPAAVRDAVHKDDLTVTKSHYSAFQATQMLRMLRAKMVMEVFLCGSLANVGVYATAMDAAGHGMSITVVEDCCGYRSDSRQIEAFRKLIDLTGCEVASCAEVLEAIQPKPKPKPKHQPKPAAKRPAPSSRPETPTPSSAARPPPANRASMSPDIVKPMTGLRLASDSPTPTPIAPEPSLPSIDGAASAPIGVDPHLEEDASKSKEAAGHERKPDTGTQDGKESAQTGPDGIGHEPPRKPDTAKPQPNAEDGPPSKQENKLEPRDEDVSQLQDGSTPESQPPPATSATSKGTGPTATETLSPESSGDDEREQQRGLCAGDTDVIEDLLPASLEQGIFERLRDEVSWQRMSHQGGEVPRLVAVQGDVADDGSIPVYRHPSDESPPLLPFSPAVLAIKAETENHLGHPLNHVLIQHYRDGNDYISEHSDKTLDIVRGSFIANVSLGAQRTMVLRTKRPDRDPSRSGATPPQSDGPKRAIHRARLPHNSLCRMGLRTNMAWLHAIRPDKRPERERSAAERAFAGARISLTFRRIGTFLDRDEALIWGQGARGKDRAAAGTVLNGQTPEAVRMLRAFGTENHASAFDWDAHYGDGFDVLHMSSAPRFFASPDRVANLRVGVMLAEYGVAYAKGRVTPPAVSKDSAPDAEAGPPSLGLGSASVKFIDNDAAKSVVTGDLAIMLYLDARHGQARAGSVSATQAELAKRFTRFQQGLLLLGKWRLADAGTEDQAPPKAFLQELAPWEGHAAAEPEAGFLAGPRPSLPDFAVWPVLHAVVEKHGAEALNGLEGLQGYYRRMADRESTKKALGKTAGPEKS